MDADNTTLNTVKDISVPLHKLLLLPPLEHCAQLCSLSLERTGQNQRREYTKGSKDGEDENIWTVHLWGERTKKRHEEIH